jgi:hypothetical protein
LLSWSSTQLHNPTNLPNQAGCSNCSTFTLSLSTKQRKKSGRQFSVAAKILAFRIYRLNFPTFRSVPRIGFLSQQPYHRVTHSAAACDDTTQARFLSQPRMAFTYFPTLVHDRQNKTLPPNRVTEHFRPPSTL